MEKLVELKNNSEYHEIYSNFRGEREYVERVKRVWYIGECDDLEVWFSDSEVFKLDFIRLGDKGLSFEVFLILTEVILMILDGLSLLLFLEFSKLAYIKYFIAIFIVNPPIF